MDPLPPILQIGDVLISSDIISEQFCCDLDSCHGACCVEGDAGAPVTLDEVDAIEETVETVWPELSAQAQAVIDRQGVAYVDEEGDLVTSIVNGRDCVFTCYDDLTLDDGHTVSNCCLCTLERAAIRHNHLSPTTHHPFIKPISCALYPIREKRFSDGTVGLNYHRWQVCREGVRKGQQLQLPLYRFLRGPLVRRFGQEWYDELCDIAKELEQLSTKTTQDL